MMNFTEEQESIIYIYCCDDMKKLKELCAPIIAKIGGISQKDYDDIYDIAMLLLYQNVNKYDKSKASFKTFFSKILKRRIYFTYIRDRNRQCRSNTKIKNGEVVFMPDISFESLSNKDRENLRKCDFEYLKNNNSDDKSEVDLLPQVKKYLDRLPKKQREIAKYIMMGYSDMEIKEILHIESSEFNAMMLGLKSFKNSSILLELLK